MRLYKNISIMISIGLGWSLIVGCGSGATTDTPAEDSILQENNETNQTEPIVTGYTVGNGVLIDSGRKLTWVNSSSDAFCRVSRSTDRSGTVYEDGVAHCQKLATENYGDINNWRLPTVDEAKVLMNRDNLDVLLFPASNPDCAIMTTDVENTFVYTTSTWNSAENVGNSFIDSERNSKTAGIRCVADQ